MGELMTPPGELADELNADTQHGMEVEFEGLVASGNTSVNTSFTGAEQDDSFDSFMASDRPRAGEDGMPRCDTYLHHFEQNELQKQVMVVVPEGMAENRMVSFMYENKKHDVQIPEGYEVGEEIPILVPKRPPLERNPAQASCRGHSNFLDRMSIIEPLRHSSRLAGPCTLDNPEFKHRQNLYNLLRGTNMNPLLPYMPEEMSEEEGEDNEVEDPVSSSYDGQDVPQCDLDC